MAIAGLGFRLGRGWSPARSEPALSATTVVQQVRDAAKLVSTEVIAAVVAKQEDLTWYGNPVIRCCSKRKRIGCERCRVRHARDHRFYSGRCTLEARQLLYRHSV